MQKNGVVFLCIFYFTVTNANIKRNVTVTGVDFNWTKSEIGSFWNATVSYDGPVQSVIGECPAGRYCPAGVSSPIVCPAGTFSDQKRLYSVCTYKCQSNNYCPDPAQSFPCPNFTTSGRGATSQAKCLCLTGYQCNYKKVVNLNIGLNVPYSVWMSPSGSALRTAVLQAVALSSGVPLGSVKIDKVLPGISRGLIGSGSGGGARRLLGTSESAVLSMSVSGADRVLDEALRGKLREISELKRGNVRIYWKSIESVKVLKR